MPAGCAIAVLIAQPVMNQISAVLARNDNMSLSASWFAQYYLLVARVDQRARFALGCCNGLSPQSSRFCRKATLAASPACRTVTTKGYAGPDAFDNAKWPSP